MRLLLVISSVCILLSFNACCKRCDISVPLLEVVYNGYDTATGEADTLLVHRYKAGSNFSQLVATDVMYRKSLLSVTYYVPGPEADVDYILELEGVGRRDTVNNFSWGEAICYECLGEKEVYFYPTGYHLNGVYHEGITVQIYK